MRTGSRNVKWSWINSISQSIIVDEFSGFSLVFHSSGDFSTLSQMSHFASLLVCIGKYEIVVCVAMKFCDSHSKTCRFQVTLLNKCFNSSLFALKSAAGVSRWAVSFISLLKVWECCHAPVDVNLLHVQHAVPSPHPKWIQCRRAMASSSTAPERARHGGTANKDGLATERHTHHRDLCVLEKERLCCAALLSEAAELELGKHTMPRGPEAFLSECVSWNFPQQKIVLLCLWLK